jgi:hypothetical protein
MNKSIPKEVYLGRGPACYQQPGNKEYRSIIKLYAPDFHRDAPKPAKSKFIESLQLKLRMQGFRFYSFSTREQEWISALECDIKEKIGHDLRDYRNNLSQTKNKFRRKKAPTKHCSNRSNALVEEIKSIHRATNWPFRKQKSKVEALDVVQQGFSRGYNIQPSVYHPLDNPTRCVTIPSASTQHFYTCDLYDKNNGPLNITMPLNTSGFYTMCVTSGNINCDINCDINCERPPRVASQNISNDVYEGNYLFISCDFMICAFKFYLPLNKLYGHCFRTK